ncbi:septum site-determining protein MinC [Tahibacter soli]|jgi:septum site-determining protein MinC|uniref:Probable septum site-determining protein MinC n=1 Tax=Tahibacter soli TaxID=2983605 RepID=A0A9X3YHU1_9GAMM|nr:septum site-determining protein MinC [Tahibacter soli]MDC8011854.1 septum site-determining protein MinC [Tahibacter soli]
MAKVMPAAEPVGELKFGQVGIANLRIKHLDLAALAQELAHKVDTAPQLFRRAPVVLDLSHLPALPPVETVRAVLATIRDAGMLPVGLAYGTSENENLAQSLDLPLFAKFRAAYEPGDAAHAPTPPPESRAPREERRTPPPPSRGTGNAAGQHQSQPVRSGQQIYARGTDLVITAMVGNGAEVIADGSVHVYAPLRGKVIAGAQGDATARIYCQDFQAELVSIAGHYRVFEDIPADLRGKPVQAWLEGEKLHLARLG